MPLNEYSHKENSFTYPKVIDYACGAGHFLTEGIEAINYFAGEGNDNGWTRDSIYGIEKDYRLARVSKISLFMNGAGEGNIIFGDGLENYIDKKIENNTFDSKKEEEILKAGQDVLDQAQEKTEQVQSIYKELKFIETKWLLGALEECWGKLVIF